MSRGPAAVSPRARVRRTRRPLQGATCAAGIPPVTYLLRRRRWPARRARVPAASQWYEHKWALLCWLVIIARGREATSIGGSMICSP